MTITSSSWPGRVCRCGTSAAPVVAETMGGTMGRPHAVVGAPTSRPIRRAANPRAVRMPSTVPTLHSTPSTAQAAPASPGQCAGTTVAVAEPVESTPMDTMPHAASTGMSRMVSANTAGRRAIRRPKATVSPTNTTHPTTSSTTASVRPPGRSPPSVWVRVAAMPVPMTDPYHCGPGGGTAARGPVAESARRRPAGVAAPSSAVGEVEVARDSRTSTGEALPSPGTEGSPGRERDAASSSGAEPSARASSGAGRSRGAERSWSAGMRPGSRTTQHTR